MKLYNEGEQHPKVVDIAKMMLGCGISNNNNNYNGNNFCFFFPCLLLPPLYLHSSSEALQDDERIYIVWLFMQISMFFVVFFLLF